MNAIRQLAAGAANILWPRVCPGDGCGRLSDRSGRHLCSRCFAALAYYDLPGDGRTAFAAHHVGTVRNAIIDFKFGRAVWLASDLVDLLEGAVRARLDSQAIDVVVPVPLHPRRHRSRGYNQSEILARGLACRIDRRCDVRSLARIKDTPHQSRQPNAEARRVNVKDAFAVRRPEFIRGRTVLLVDDVTTSCATLDACAEPLRAAGAFRVWYATVAKRGDE